MKIEVTQPRTRKQRIHVKVDKKSGMKYETLDGKTLDAISIIESFRPNK